MTGRPSRQALAQALAALPHRLEVFAWELHGIEGTIEAVAKDDRGGVTVVAWAPPGRDLAALADLAAQAAWLAPRLADWAQLAPDRGLDPARPPEALLLAPRFDPRTRLAAGRLVPSPALGLWLSWSDGPRIWFDGSAAPETVEPPGETAEPAGDAEEPGGKAAEPAPPVPPVARPRTPPPAPRPRDAGEGLVSRFRSFLREEDL